MRDMRHHKRNQEAWTIFFWRSQDEETIDKPKETLDHVITYPSQQAFQWAKNFVILISYEKFMPILVKMPKTFSVKRKCPSADAKKNQTNLHKLTSLHSWLSVFGCVYLHIKVDMFHAGRLVFKGKSGKNFNF